MRGAFCAPSQSHFVRQLSQRESPWHVGQVYAGRAKHDVSGTVVLRCLGSRQLDKVRCPEAAALCSKARPFAPYRASGVQQEVARPAKASPFGRGGTEGDGEGKDAAKQLLHSDSIALTKNLLIAAQKLFCPGLALSGATRQLSQRESLWHVGQVYAGRAKHNISGTVVRCCQDSR